MSGRSLTVTEAWAEMERTGLSGACVIEEHRFCTPPLDVYVRQCGEPLVGPPAVSIRCACACHAGHPVRREVVTV